MVHGFPIVSYTFLADDRRPRLFNVYNKETKELVMSTPLHNGDLLAMAGDMQTRFEHEVPTQTLQRFKGDNPQRRINLTVRAFKVLS